ncbi:MAG: DUF1801 domain-containing protein [Chitinophagaceae bacterium]
MEKMQPAASVDEYIKRQPAKVQGLLQQMRQTIKAAAPAAKEVISYSIPGYTQEGMLVFFAAWANHISFYPAPWEAEALKKQMSPYKGSKGTIRFPLDKALPITLITKMVKYKLKQNLEKAGAKKTKMPPAKKTALKKTSDEEQVKNWMNKLEAPVRKEVEAVRQIIKKASPLLNERIKWNAPSYYYKEDILTFGPYKKEKILLVFHHPAVVKIQSGLLEGDYKDRRLVYFKNKAEAEKNGKELSRIIREIVKMIGK